MLPKWLSARALAIAALASAIAGYAGAAKTGFSTEGVVGWIVSTVVGGVFGGALITWVVEKIGKKP